jgi:hypothetical protein
MSVLDKMTSDQVQTLATFMERWNEADRKVNGDSHYKHFMAGLPAIRECVADFTSEQKQFIQECLDDAYPNIPKINILN